MVGFVLGGIRKDGHEGMDSIQLVIGNDHEESEKTLLDGKEVIINWLPFEGGEGDGGLFEEVDDCVRHHVEMKQEDKLLRSSFLCYYRRAGAVENRDDDDQSDCIDKGNLRVLGAFGDSSESVGSHDCDCSSGSLVGIKFKLDFHCREQ